MQSMNVPRLSPELRAILTKAALAAMTVGAQRPDGSVSARPAN
ncbi:hypothetical protein [Consotaella salsifontis]|uniref:Uncharacterized protein n=1 Tax=Consotaella salsifontis TaxID=1365950 RepID=A0A1T4P6F3_9HYPH|nr:hypothetical protein [Consotaella salsifontis]SJZ87029.1 hypothetical protein SAMN05428963_103360 [Consotaella salsifontis]